LHTCNNGCIFIVLKQTKNIMKNLIQNIENKLQEGYKLQEVVTHKSSHYFYITRPDGIQLVARLSDHEAIAASSKSHVQVISDIAGLHIDFEFATIYDENDFEVELTKAESLKQLNAFYNIELNENNISDFDEFSCIIETEDWKVKDEIIATYISNEITKVEATNLY